MAAQLNRALLAAAVLLLLDLAPAAAALPARAGVARAVAGEWSAALDRLEALPTDARGPAERYFQAAAQLELGLTEPGLAGLRALSDSGGSFSGPALERAVQTLFEAGRYSAVTEWAAASRAASFQDAAGLAYRVGQSQLLLGRTEDARGTLGRVTGGALLPYALHSRALLEVPARRFGAAVDLLGEAITAAEAVRPPAVAVALADALRVARGRALYQLAANASDLEEADRRALAELAREQFERVGEESLLYPEALRGIGWCALEAGDSSRALASFAAAGGMDPAGQAEDLWAQGRVYQRLGYFDEAARLYREAGAAAVAIAARLEAEPGFGATPVPTASRWEQRRAAAEGLETRRHELAARLGALEEAAAARARRLEAAGRRIEAQRARVADLEQELVTSAARLQEFLDQIPATALFPPEERDRARALADVHQRLDNDVARIEGALGALGNSVFWTRASAAQRDRGQALWERLDRAKGTLGDVQLAFLLALKQRVSQRETELARQIEQLQLGSRGLAEPLASADRARVAALARSAALESRLARLRQRVAAVQEPLAGLGKTAAAQELAADAQAQAEQAQALRLRADAYALDEAQALHLTQERPR